MLITLHRPGHSSFVLLWDWGRTPPDNLASLARWIAGAWGTANGKGWGCICGWSGEHTMHWPSWFWHWWWWSRHVKVCPLPRNEYGDVI
jgi:hypothetical protein